MSSQSRRVRSVSCPALATLFCILLAACGEDAGDDTPIDAPSDTGENPALVVVVSPLNTRRRELVYGEEIRVLFSKDPGAVVLDYDGATPLTPVVGTRTMRAFLLERNSTILRWDHGGATVLGYGPILPRTTPVPMLMSTWPKFDAQHVSYDNINTRTDITLGFAALGGLMIPRLRVDKATITDPDGVTWEPDVIARGSTVRLIRRKHLPYELAHTYRVHVEVTFLVPADAHKAQEYDYEFRVQD